MTRQFNLSTTALFTAVLLFVLAGGQAFAQGARWHTSPQQAVDQANTSGKMIIVSVGADWCHFCKKMDKEVWRDDRVSRFVAKSYVPLKITDEDHGDLIQALRVKAFPTTLVFTSDRRLVARLEGFVAAEKMVEALQKIQMASLEGFPQTR